MKDWQSISESPFYEKANAYVEETHNNDCTLEAFIDGAESRQAEIAELEKENAELKSENQKWKDEWQEQVQKATDEGYARTLQTIQLTKARNLMRRLLDCGSFGMFKNTVTEAENFLKESDVEK